jgi:hypothetical protein
MRYAQLIGLSMALTLAACAAQTISNSTRFAPAWWRMRRRIHGRVIGAMSRDGQTA